MPFEVLWEVDPPIEPDLTRLGRQLDAIDDLATCALVPDCPTGRAAVSSLVTAQLVQAGGLPAIACLNARDRNLLGLRRDLLTARVLGIDEVVLVQGDAPEAGARASDLRVGVMLDECRDSSGGDVRVGLTTAIDRSLPAWKRDADRLLVQVSWSVDALVRWRERIDFVGPVYPAVLVVPSIGMARRLAARVPELAVPPAWLEAIAADPRAGFVLAASLVKQIRDSGAFEGVHLIGGVRFATAAAAVRRALRPDSALTGATP